MKNLKLRYADDATAQELFRLAGAALVDPGEAEPRRAFWRHIDAHSDHEWVKVAKRSAAASHPRGLTAGNELVNVRIDEAYGRPWAGQPEWLSAAFKAFQ